MFANGVVIPPESMWYLASNPVLVGVIVGLVIVGVVSFILLMTLIEISRIHYFIYGVFVVLGGVALMFAIVFQQMGNASWRDKVVNTVETHYGVSFENKDVIPARDEERTTRVVARHVLLISDKTQYLDEVIVVRTGNSITLFVPEKSNEQSLVELPGFNIT